MNYKAESLRTLAINLRRHNLTVSAKTVDEGAEEIDRLELELVKKLGLASWRELNNRRIHDAPV